MKFLLTFCLIASLATVAWTRSESWGKRYSNDYLLYRENVVRRPIKNNYLSVNVVYPKSGQGNWRNISSIIAYDWFRNSSGATPAISYGGIGYTFATVNLKSQYSSGINTTVEIYGR